MADTALLAVLIPLAAIGAVALVAGAVWLWRRGRRPEPDAPAVEDFAGLAVSRSEAHAAELAALRRTVERQRAALDEAAELLAAARLAERTAQTNPIDKEA